MTNRNASIKKAQERKERSIAYFSSVKAAIELKDTPFTEEGKKMIVLWRDWCFSEWEKKREVEQAPEPAPPPSQPLF
jgi:hypothetical protein